MRVRAVLRGHLVLVEPDPVEVLVGEPLYWEFVSTGPQPRIRWEVYFQRGSPFSAGIKSLTAQTVFSYVPPGPLVPNLGIMHYGLSPSVVATTPGDYKYGVRAEDADTGVPIADDDPRLIVRI